VPPHLGPVLQSGMLYVSLSDSMHLSNYVNVETVLVSPGSLLTVCGLLGKCDGLYLHVPESLCVEGLVPSAAVFRGGVMRTLTS
jgi:hypothetical protein